MPDPLPACFRGRAAGGPPPSTEAGPSLTTSVYETHLGLALLTWSRTVLGLSLRVELRLSAGAPAAGGVVVGTLPDEEEEEPLKFRVRPWLLWKRRGSKRFHLRDRRRSLVVDVAWDLARARFPSGGGPEPYDGFFVAVAVDGEMLLVAGDLGNEAYKRMKAARAKYPCAIPVLVSRKEHVVMGESGGGGGGRSYRTRARFGGREREIKIELGGARGEDGGMSVGVDGRRVLQVRRLRWKFRGSEMVVVEGGARVLISWDLYNWLFQPPKDDAPPSAAPAAVPEIGNAAVFVFRFEREAEDGHSGRGGGGGEEKGKGGEDFSRLLVYRGIGGYFGKRRNWSDSSSGGGERRMKGTAKSLLKTRSSSSSSSASSASSSSVMEWASPEEVELRSADGFSLLVYAWKS